MSKPTPLSRTKNAPSVRYGLRFAGLEPQEAIFLHSYVYQQLVEDGACGWSSAAARGRREHAHPRRRRRKHDGFEFVRALRSGRTLRDIPVVFLTSLSDGEDRGRDLGAVAYLTKPVQADTLLAVVAAAVAADRALFGESAAETPTGR